MTSRREVQAGQRKELGWGSLALLVAFVVVCIVLGGALGLWVFAQAVEWVGSGE